MTKNSGVARGRSVKPKIALRNVKNLTLKMLNFDHLGAEVSRDFSLA